MVELIALPAPIDRGFVRYLLTQEICAHRHYWWFDPSIEIAALLVADHRDPADVWLLHEAIYANFDTCGILPRHLLISAGIDRVRSHIAITEHPRKTVLLDDLDQLPDAAVEQILLARRGRYLPAGPAPLRR